MLRTVWRLCTGAVLLACLVLPAGAQEITAQLQGVVADASGGVLPGATVTIRRVETGRTVEVVSNADGRYVATGLEPGSYEVTFNLSGFKPVTVRGVKLSVNDRLEVNGTLPPSSCSRRQRCRP